MNKRKFKLSVSWLVGMLSVIAFTPMPCGFLLGCGCLIMILIT